MHIAPPVDRLHPSSDAHPTMVSQKRAKLRVDASFDPIGGRRHRPFDAEGRVEIGEQGSFVDERNEGASRFSQPLVRVAHATIDEALLGEKVVPELAPLQEPFHPPIGLLERLDMQELFRMLVELGARFEVRPGRRISFDLAERMEEASLDSGIRPASPSRFRKAGASIGDDHVGRSDAREEGLPCPRCLGAREIPRQDVLIRTCDEYYDVLCQIDAIDIDDAMDLVNHGRHGPYLPESLSASPEAPALPGHIDLPVFGEQP